jgi:hypothetical protein
MRRLLACLTLAALAAPAAACYNDVELPSHEREFRSQYKQPASAPAPAAAPSYPDGSPLLLGCGAVLLIGAVGVAGLGTRTRK